MNVSVLMTGTLVSPIIHSSTPGPVGIRRRGTVGASGTVLPVASPTTVTSVGSVSGVRPVPQPVPTSPVSTCVSQVGPMSALIIAPDGDDYSTVYVFDGEPMDLSLNISTRSPFSGYRQGKKSGMLETETLEKGLKERVSVGMWGK